MFTIKDVDTKPTGNDHTSGAMESDSLRIRGYVREGSLERRNSYRPEGQVYGLDDRFFGVASLDYTKLLGPVYILLLFKPPGSKRFYMLLRRTGGENSEYRRVDLLVDEAFDHGNHIGTLQTVTVV